MLSFSQFVENVELFALRQHLKNPSIDIASHSNDFTDWKGSKAVLAKAKIKPADWRAASEEFDDEFYELSKRIETAMTPADVESFMAYLSHNNPGDMPSHSLMDIQTNRGRKGFLPPTTWLVHFSDHAQDVAVTGLSQGQDQMDRLALTTHQSDYDKSRGGYNFAFTAGSRYAIASARTGKYGKHAVMFQAAGVPVYHNSDEEDQVVLWGANVPAEKMVLLTNDGDWSVHAKRGKRDVLYTGDIKACMDWVVKNYRQYRKVL